MVDCQQMHAFGLKVQEGNSSSSYLILERTKLCSVCWWVSPMECFITKGSL